MNALLESPAAFVAIGVLIVTAGAIPFVQTRSIKALGLLIVAVLLAVGGLVFERVWITPRESVQRAVGTLFDRVESNDLPGVLTLIDSSSTQLRSDAESLMPRFVVEAAGEGGEVRVKLPEDPTIDGAIATAYLTPVIRAQHKQTGATGGLFNKKFEFDFVRRDGRWLAVDYRSEIDLRDRATRLGR